MRNLKMILIILFSVSSLQANERCTLDKKVISSHRGYKKLFTTVIENNFKVKIVRSWGECFQYAVKESYKMESQIGEYSSVHLLNNSEGKLTKTKLQFDRGYLFVKWSYNDSYLWDTSGEVNKYTDINIVTSGDVRATSDGDLLIY